MLEWYAAARSAALNPDERHLALSSVEHPLDRDRQVLLAAQGLHVRLKAAEHRVATLVSRGSGPARVLLVLDLRVPVGLRRLLQTSCSAPLKRVADNFNGLPRLRLLPQPGSSERFGAFPEILLAYYQAASEREQLKDRLAYCH